MKDVPPVDPFEDARLLARRRPRRRKHGPKPNMATWIVLAWLAFMVAWGGKYLYRQWSEAVPGSDSGAESVEIMPNMAAPEGVDDKADTSASCLPE